MITLHGIEVHAGDNVWSLAYGWAKVVAIKDYGTSYQIITDKNWDIENRHENESAGLSHLYWQEFEIPKYAFEKPKQMVKKYVVLYERSGEFYTTQDWIIPHFSTVEEFNAFDGNSSDLFVQFILESMIEVEE